MPVLKPPLSVRGAAITDSGGHPVKLAGVNWAGAHQDGVVPSMLDRLHRDVIARRIAAAGFNHVRLPFALGTIVNQDGSPRTGLADQSRLAANPDLQGLTPWGVYQAVTESLMAAGLAVIPNCHLLHPGWCCSDADGNGLWYNQNWSASVFIKAWMTVAARFAGDKLVIGHDLKNEPRKARFGGATHIPTWGDGNTATDFRHMYSDMASRIQAADPDALFFCEGLSYASDLTKAGAHPVTPTRPGKVVYSVHDYSWFHPAGQSQQDYITSMDARSGYLVTQGRAPLWVGEWGSDNSVRPGQPRGSFSPSSAAQQQWFANARAWIAARGVSWCWWVLDAWHVKGTEPVTNKLVYADGDQTTYGLLAGQDGLGTSKDLIGLLRALM
jgi:endoglucanase